MSKTIKSKYGADLLLVSVSMIGLPRALLPWRILLRHIF